MPLSIGHQISCLSRDYINRDQEGLGSPISQSEASIVTPPTNQERPEDWCQPVRESRCVWTIPLIFCLDNLDNAITSLTKILVTPSFGDP